MLIACPACATTYDLSAAQIGGGRKVRCVRCRTRWFVPAPAMAEAALAEAMAGDPVGAGGGPELPAPPSTEPALDAMWGDALAEAAAPRDSAAEAERSDAPTLEAPPLAPDAAGTSAEAGLAPVALDDPPAGDPPHEDIETIAARRVRLARERRRRRQAAWIPLTLALVVPIVIGLIAGRERVVRAAPQAAGFFAALGLPVNLRGLEFQGLRSSDEIEDGVPFLIVRGEIVNITERRVEVPRLRFALRNPEGVEVYAWTALPPRHELGPGERLPFASRLASPPPDAHDVMLRFFHRRDLDRTR